MTFTCSMTCNNGQPVIYRGSTPTLNYTTPFTADEVTSITASFEQRGEFVFDKTCQVEDKKATVELTSSETEMFNEAGLPLVYTQLVVELAGGAVATSNILSFQCQRVIGGGDDNG